MKYPMAFVDIVTNQWLRHKPGNPVQQIILHRKQRENLNRVNEFTTHCFIDSHDRLSYTLPAKKVAPVKS